jgi:ankyrin repeat protein
LFKALNEDFGLNFIKYVLDEKKAKIDINWKDKNGQTVLCHAVSFYRDLDIVRYLVGQKHADVNIFDEKKRSPLHMATFHGSSNILKYLVDHGADLECKDQDGNTPLHETLRYLIPQDDICKYLVERGAEVNKKNNKGETPLRMAISRDLFELCKYMIQHGGVDVDRKNEDGETLMHVAAAGNKIKLLDFLVREKHADVNTPRTSDHWTPLHCAALWNHYNSCEYLIQHGANTGAKGTCGKTAAQVASDKRVIHVLTNASNKTRRCRSVGFHVPALNFNPEPFESSERLVDVGNSGESLMVSVQHTRPFHLYSFLIAAHWFVLCVRSLARLARPDERRSHWSPAGILQNKMDSVAEDAILALPF